MQINVTQPELEKFIAEQVAKGHYKSAEAMIEALLSRQMHDDSGTLELDEDLLDAIDEAEDEIDRGEVLDWEVVKAELEHKYLKK